jgi:hypothetical protein
MCSRSFIQIAVKLSSDSQVKASSLPMRDLALDTV